MELLVSLAMKFWMDYINYSCNSQVQLSIYLTKENTCYTSNTKKCSLKYYTIKTKVRSFGKAYFYGYSC